MVGDKITIILLKLVIYQYEISINKIGIELLIFLYIHSNTIVFRRIQMQSQVLKATN